MKTPFFYPLMRTCIRLLFGLALLITINESLYAQTPGSLDLSFDPGSGANGFVSVVKQLSNGKVLIGGSFSEYNGVTRTGLALLHQDGSLDLAFAPNFIQNNSLNILSIECATQQSDGKLLVGGRFSSCNGLSRNGIVRINLNGSVDQTFVVGSGFSNSNNNHYFINHILIVSNQKILIAGSFDSYNGTSRRGLIRIDHNGSIDNSFNVNSFPPNSVVNRVIEQSNGQIILSGIFTFTLNNTLYGGIIRVNNVGDLDITFNPTTFQNYVGTFQNYVGSYAVVRIFGLDIQPDGKILIGGDVFMLNTSNSSILLYHRIFRRINTNGSIDVSFNATDGVEGITRAIICKNNKIYICGSIMSVNNVSSTGFAVLDLNGTLDQTYINNNVNEIITMDVQTDNKLLIGGAFHTVGTIPRLRIARLHGGVSCTAPAFTQQPVGAMVCASTGATFNYSVTGTPPFTVQWKRNGVNFGSASTGTQSPWVGSTSATLAGTYTVEVTNACGTVTSSGAVLSNIPSPTRPESPSCALMAEPCDQGYPIVGFNLTWQPGSGTRRIVVASTEPIGSFPSDNVSYSADPVFTSGDDLGNGVYVVYDGGGNSVFLQKGTPYLTGKMFFAVFEYNSSCGETSYLRRSYASAVFNIEFDDYEFVECNTGLRVSGSSESPIESIKVKTESIDLFPNPNEGSFDIQIKEMEGEEQMVQYKVMNVAGKEVGAGSFQGSSMHVDMNGQQPGVYFIHIQHGGKHEIKKIILQ